jgi:AraC-like DNA-binding protein
MMYGERRARTVAATVWQAIPDRGVRPDGGLRSAGTSGESGTDGAATASVAGDGGSSGPTGAGAVASGPTAHRVLPDGCMDLIWSRAGAGDTGQIIVAGPDTAATVTLWRPGVVHLGLRFDSAVGPAHIGVPASEVRDRRVPLAEIWGRAEATRLAERLAAADAPAATFEAEIFRRGRRDGLTDLLAPSALAGIQAGAPVAQVARTAALSERQLLRRCQLAVGYGPKTLARIVRFRRALALARSGTPFAAVAAEAGYADQSHLAREVHSLGGAPLGELIVPAA